MKELYSKLGFTEEESRLQGEEFQKLCKKKFRELSKQWHPDRWSNKSEEERKKAEEKFKEINEANEILSDPKKRQMYDMTGSTNGQFQGGPGEGGFDGFNPFEGFGEGFDPFDGMFGSRRKRTPRGTDVQVQVDITMKEAFTGVKKDIEVPIEKACSHCNGTGSADSKSTECPYCHGTGFISQISINGNVQMETRHPCPHCHGSGRIVTNPCPHCHGSGKEYTYVKKHIDIPAGVFTGAAMSLEGEGNAPEGGVGRNGNLYVNINVIPDPNFERREDDIIFTLPVTLLEAWRGCKKDVYNIDGKRYTVNIPPLTKSETYFHVSQDGFSHVNYFGRGNFIVKVVYKMPRILTPEQIKLLEQFYEIEEKK